MGLFASLRNAVRWAGFDLGRTDGASAQAVVMIDPATGLPVSPTNVTLSGPVTVSNTVEVTNDVGNPLPVSGPLTNAELRSTAVLTEPLGVPSVARQLTAGAASANTVLTASCRRISIRARNADIRFAIGTGAQTAVATTSHFIGQDERLDYAVPANAQIAVIRDSLSSVDGSLALTELS